ncbi:MAG: 5-(carboxyamino)imidazole ribonucleotide mutase [Phycisphaerales bacterium]|jgi:5-(carboxyamino)imidazole ribonucleotide mutase|nr:5-(carboxyamino)imidazole ribonucleotide mutase [Phycisphaerales bacterium]
MATITTVENAQISILMGSSSDWPTMKRASEVLESFDVLHECNAISAHRNANLLKEYLLEAEKRGIELFICAAGGAAHLAGVVAAHTEKPVLGCPMQAWSLDGLDSLLSTVQMPKGIPVATFAIGGAGATNAAIFAVQMLAMSDSGLADRFSDFRVDQSEKITSLL